MTHFVEIKISIIRTCQRGKPTSDNLHLMAPLSKKVTLKISDAGPLSVRSIPSTAAIHLALLAPAASVRALAGSRASSTISYYDK